MCAHMHACAFASMPVFQVYTQRTTWGICSFPMRVCSKYWAPVVRVVDKHLYPPNHLISPHPFFSFDGCALVTKPWRVLSCESSEWDGWGQGLLIGLVFNRVPTPSTERPQRYRLEQHFSACGLWLFGGRTTLTQGLPKPFTWQLIVM